jgi:hypothetical protein
MELPCSAPSNGLLGPYIKPLHVGPFNEIERTRQFIDWPHWPGWIAISQHTGRDITCHNATGPNKRALANGDVRQQSDVDSYTRPTLDRRPTHAQPTQGVRIVSDGDARRQEYVIFQGGELGNIDIAMDLDIVPDCATIVYGRTVPNVQTATDTILLTDDHVVTGLQTGPDGGSGIDHCAIAYARSGSDAQCQIVYLAARKITQHDTRIHLTLVPQDDLLSNVKSRRAHD